MLPTRAVRGVIEAPADAATFQRSLMLRIALQAILVVLLIAPLGNLGAVAVISALFFNAAVVLEYAGRWSDR